MKIYTYGDAWLVDRVFAYVNAVGLNLSIETHEKWMSFHRAGSSVQHLAAGHLAKHDCVEISITPEDGPLTKCGMTCEVVFEAETPEEEALLGGVAYSAQDGDQITILKVKRELSLSARQLLSTHRPDQHRKRP